MTIADRPTRARWALLLALALALPAVAGAQDKLPGVGWDLFPNQPDPYETGQFDADAYVARYGQQPAQQQHWPGMVAEMFFANERALRAACLAGAIGDRDRYNCQPTTTEQLDLAYSTRRPYLITGVPGERIFYSAGSFYCMWWYNQGPDPGRTPQNPIPVSRSDKPAGLFDEPPSIGWSCPVYYVNTPPAVEPPPACVENATTVCLNGGRFKVEATWRTPQGQTGPGRANRLTEDTTSFWFFEDTNVEMIVKVLNACVVNQRYWVFAGGLTNVEVQLKVTDTATGEFQTYVNPQGRAFQPIQDTEAFPGC